MNNRTASLTRTLTSEPHSQVQVIISRLLRRLLTKLKKKLKPCSGFFPRPVFNCFRRNFRFWNFRRRERGATSQTDTAGRANPARTAKPAHSAVLVAIQLISLKSLLQKLLISKSYWPIHFFGCVGQFLILPRFHAGFVNRSKLIPW